jgi:hypothetical protein
MVTSLVRKTMVMYGTIKRAKACLRFAIRAGLQFRRRVGDERRLYGGRLRKMGGAVAVEG